MRLYIPLYLLGGGPKRFAETFIKENNRSKIFEIFTEKDEGNIEVDCILGIAFYPLKKERDRIRTRKLLHRLNGIAEPGQHFNYYMGLGSELANLANHVVFQSDYCKNLWNPYISPKKYSVIYNGADIELWNPHSRKQRDYSSTINLLSISHSVFDRKRLDRIIEISERVPEGFSLRVIGNYAQVKDRTKQKEESEKIFKDKLRVSYSGLLNPAELKSEIDKADFVLAPAIEEPCSNSIIEVLCCGCPVIYSRSSGGTQEFIGDAGMMIDYDSENIFERIRDCLWLSFEDEARKKYRELSSEVMFNKYAEEIRRICSE